MSSWIKIDECGASPVEGLSEISLVLNRLAKLIRGFLLFGSRLYSEAASWPRIRGHIGGSLLGNETEQTVAVRSG